MKQPIIVAPLSSLHFPATQRLHIIETVCQLERIEYGEGKHRLPHVFSGLVAKNDDGLICAMDGDKLVGYADVWQLQERFYNQLLYGVRAEEEIYADCVLSKNEPDTGYWYIGSIITDPTFRMNCAYQAAQTFSEILRQAYVYFEKVRPPAKVMGVGSTEFGKKLLGQHGFKPITPSPKAIDLRPRFENCLIELELELEH